MHYQELSPKTFFWALQGLSALHRKPFSLELAQQQCAAPHTNKAFITALDQIGFNASTHKCAAGKLHKEAFPLIAWCREVELHDGVVDTVPTIAPAMVLQADGTNILVVEHTDAAPTTISLAQFAQRYTGQITRVTPKIDMGIDADSAAQEQQARRFGFSWFVPELLKHKKHWQEILLASLVIQLIALATPLFTQAIIDKVVVHRSESTLIVIAIGMLVFMLFSAALSWLRQYLVLHTGNRVDAVLGSAVFERLFKLPPLYFQHRSTGVIAARMHGVETIREFIASAAVTVILDLPFLLIFVAIMFYYSVTLTLIVLAILAVIVTLSALVAPLFQTKLQQQFQLGARNQAL